MFTATIKSIDVTNSNISVGVVFNDSGTGFTAATSFDFPNDGTTTILSATAVIKAAGLQYKNNLAANVALQAKVGSIITI